MTECEPGMLEALLLSFATFLIIIFLFVLTQYKTLALIRPENRRMHPMLVWLQLIPLFGIFWQFYVIRYIAEAIRKELNTRGQTLTYIVGLAYASLLCLSCLPLTVFYYFSATGLGMWIIYWALLLRLKRQLKKNNSK